MGRYYYHPTSKRESWTCPKEVDGRMEGDGKTEDNKPVPAKAHKDLLEAARENVLPQHWVKLVNPSTGKPFYVHLVTQRTTNVRPKTSSAPPPAPARRTKTQLVRRSA